ncbi:GNAT family protein [Nonomuraea wenchangensis]
MTEHGGTEQSRQPAGAPSADLGRSPRVVLRRITSHDQDEFLERVRATAGLNLPATLGCASFAPFAGRGYMSEGLGLVLRHAFDELRLHRLEAQIRPENLASVKLVRRHGFRYEGYSPDLLFINGVWQGHGRWALTNDMHGVVPDAPHPTLPDH